MDESALRTLLNNLDASRSSWHGLLHVFTFLVIVGLGFDLFVIIKEFWDDLKEFRYGQVHPHEIHLPKRPSASLLVLGLIGTALIVIGVWGELYVDVKVAKVETDIRAANDALLGIIIQEAGDAKTSAERAKAGADSVAATARELASELARFRAEAGARRLSPKQKELLRKALEKTTGGVLGVGFNPYDQEAEVFANDFIETLKSAHWHPVTQWFTAWKPGLFIAFTGKEALDAPRFRELRDALKGIGTPAENWQIEVGDKSLSPPVKAGDLYLLIGSHPPVSANAN